MGPSNGHTHRTSVPMTLPFSTLTHTLTEATALNALLLHSPRQEA